MNSIKVLNHSSISRGRGLVALVGIVAAVLAMLVPSALQPTVADAATGPEVGHASERGSVTAAKRCRKRGQKVKSGRSIKRSRRPRCRKRGKAPVLPPVQPPSAERPQDPPAATSEPAPAGTQEAAEVQLFEHQVSNVQSVVTPTSRSYCSDWGGMGDCTQPTYVAVCTNYWVPMSYYSYPYLARYFNWFTCRGGYVGYSELSWEYRPELRGWYGWEWGPYAR